MSKQPKKKNGSSGQTLLFIIFFIIGGVFGFLGTHYSAQMTQDSTLVETVLIYILEIFVLIIGIFLQVIIHETGHLIFGLLSGYKFSSFRISSLIFVKENDQLKIKKLKIAGTGGQCLMTPPDLIDGKMPVVLYNLGGSILNIILSTIFAVISFFTASIPLLSMSMLIIAVIGVAFALINGVPMRLGLVDNDGYNAFSLTRNPKALKAFWISLKANAQIATGVRIKDLPAEWFEMPDCEDLKNSMVATQGALSCNYLLDTKRFVEAKEQISYLLNAESGIVGLTRNGLICDQIYLEIITDNQREVVEALLTKEQKKFMKQMKNHPSIIRTQFVISLLFDKDCSKAAKFKEQFNKAAKSYPYHSELQSELELMEFAEKLAL